MSTGREWISGMYGTKTGTLNFQKHSIGYCRGFFVEPGIRVRWICKVRRVVQAINERIYDLVKAFVIPFDTELPYADAADPHKEYERGFGDKQALGNEEIGSSQKKVMEVRSRLFLLGVQGVALRCPLPRESNKCPVYATFLCPVRLKCSSDIGPAMWARNVSVGCFVSRVFEHQQIIKFRRI